LPFRNQTVATTSWTVEFETSEGRLLSSLAGIRADLDFTIEACKRIESFGAHLLEDVLVYEALSLAALIRYARCFATGRRRKFQKDLIARLPDDLQQRHERFMTVRNKHVAHPTELFEKNLVVVHVSDDPQETEVQSVSAQHARVLGLDRGDAIALGKLAEALRAELLQIERGEAARLLELARSKPYDTFRGRGMPTTLQALVENVTRIEAAASTSASSGGLRTQRGPAPVA